MAWGACCLVCAIVVLACCACSSHEAPIDSGPPTPEPILELRINEVVSNNEGVQVDEQGEVDDYVELFNPTLDALDLGAYLIFDDSGGHALPQRSLAPGATLLLWADDSPEQGELHLPFKISAAGERLRLIRRDAAVVDDVTVPALREHHAYSRMPDGTGPFADCAWATPARTNGSSCGPRHEQTMSPSDDYLPYAWPSPWPAIPTPLRISEARLLPADFVEVENTSGALLSLEGIELRLAATNARLDWPTPSDGVELTFPQASLAAGEVLRVSVTEAELSEIAQTPNFEGVLSAFDRTSGQLVDRLIALADPAEALAFWAERKPSARPLVPRLDLSLRGIVPLSERSLEDIPSIGGKAAQLAELGKVELCEGTSIPGQAFAIPVVYSLEHYERSGASALLAELRGDPAFLADPSVRAAGLDRVRKLLEKQPLDPALHALVRDAIAARWPPGRVRFRSSSNVEDLVGFNGAGLYVSEGVDVDTDADIDAAVLSVWASLWNNRAFSEREYYKVDQSQVAMAVLVHPAFPSERANGVAVSRNVIDPGMVGQMYINAQVGEALVTNPAPGVASDEYVYDLASMRRTVHQHSSFSPDALVMSDRETQQLSCSVQRIHEHFSPLLDPNQENSWFAMDMEFKLMGPERSLLIKQARLYSFGQELPEGWCEL